MSRKMSCLRCGFLLSLIFIVNLKAKSILPVEEVEDYNTDFLLNLTTQLMRVRRYDSFVTYCNNRQEIRLERLFTEKIGIPVVVWGHNVKGRLREMISQKNLVFVTIECVNDTILEVVDETLTGLHWVPILFIYKRTDNAIPNQVELHKFFAWCWEVNLLNVALTYQTSAKGQVQNQIFGYTPFPKITVKNLTNLMYKPTEIFSYYRPISNVRGYRFEVPVFQNPPSVMVHLENSPPTLGGFVGNSFTTFIKGINGTIAVRYEPNVTSYTYHERLLLEPANNRIDIGIHPFTRMQPLFNETQRSFPISTTNSCVIVPFVNEIPLSDYIFRSRLSYLWYTLPGLWLLLLVLGYLSNKSWRFSESLYHTSCLLFTQSLPGKAFRRLRVPYKFLFLSALLCALIIINMNNATLSSALSTRIVDRQITTVEEFLATDLKILAVEVQKRVYFGSNHLPSALLDRVQLTDIKTLSTHIRQLNTSYAYIVQGHFWELLSQRQRRLHQPRFRIAGKELCTAQHFMHLPLQWDSLFYRSMYQYFLNTQAMGLEQMWRYSSREEAIKMGMLIILEDEVRSLRPLSLAYFTHVVEIYIVMNLLCILCFACECGLKHYQKRAAKNMKIRQINKKALI